MSSSATASAASTSAKRTRRSICAPGPRLPPASRPSSAFGLKDVTAADCAKLVIAYEPVWAIGTGRTATPDQAQEVHALIRATLAKLVGAETAETVRIQYGGSMKPGNAAELLAKKDIDGGLIGGAALKAADFAGIVAAAN